MEWAGWLDLLPDLRDSLFFFLGGFCGGGMVGRPRGERDIATMGDVSPSRAHPKCLCCKEFFLPSKPNRGRQRFCAKEPCRKASKAHSQRQWSQQANNRDYFRGPTHVERVRAWRRQNPGYARRKTRPRPLQDFVIAQVAAVESLREEPIRESAAFPQKGAADCAPEGVPQRALQDLAIMQHPLIVGLISSLMGEALQENLALLTGRLVEQGQRWLAKNPSGLGRCSVTENSNSC